MFKKFVAGVAGMIVGDFLWDCVIQPKLDELMLEIDGLNDLECYDDEGIECEDCELRDECAAANEHVGEEHFADTEKETPKKHSEHHHFQDARGSFWHVEYVMDENGGIDEIRVLDQLSKEEWLKSIEKYNGWGEFSF